MIVLKNTLVIFWINSMIDIVKTLLAHLILTPAYLGYILCCPFIWADEYLTLRKSKALLKLQQSIAETLNNANKDS